MTDAQTEETDAREDSVERARSWTSDDTIALSAVTAIGALLRLWHLGDPESLVFDEVYYAKDSCWYVNTDENLCDINYEATQVHPPLGKWLMAIGIRLAGYDSFGWRISAAVAGIVTVVLLYLLAKRLLRSTLGATIASGLLAFDLLHFVQSRIAMLDIFVALFGVAAFLFLVYDRDRVRDGPSRARRSWWPQRPWRLAAGAAAGAAAASKWSGIFVLVAIALLAVLWEIAARRRDGRGRVIQRFLREEAGGLVLALVLVPALAYIATYPGRIEGDFFSLPWSQGSWFRALVERHIYMYDFHAGLEATHSYQSPGWSWVLIKRPVSYFYCAGAQCTPALPEGRVAEIFAVGNPFVWWTSILALVFAAARWARRRDVFGPEAVIIVGFVVTYAYWALPFLDRPAVFIFYLLPTVPFMLLALAYVATQIGRSWEAKTAIVVFSAITIGLFVFYYPLVAKVPLDQEDWQRRIWVFDNCDKPPGVEVTTTVTEVVGTKTEIKSSLTTSDASLAPKGWCWI